MIISGALIILAYCTDKMKSANFQDVIYSMCGKRWQTINSLCIILYMFGCCITFFIIIGDQLDQSMFVFSRIKTIFYESKNKMILNTIKKFF